MFFTDELTNQRDALIDEIQCLKQQHQDETEKLTSDYKKELTSLEERLKQEKEDAVTEGMQITFFKSLTLHILNLHIIYFLDASYTFPLLYPCSCGSAFERSNDTHAIPRAKCK